MPFITIKPIRNRLSSAQALRVVRAVFSKFKRESTTGAIVEGYNLTLYIGKDLAKELNLNAGNKISLAYDSDDKRKWLIKKSDRGYTLKAASSGQTSPAYKVMLRWQIFTPEEKDMKLHKVSHEKHEEGLLIIAN